MKYYLKLFLLFVLIFGCSKEKRKFSYPELENSSKEETHFGISYTNYFANLENITNENVHSWFEEQDSIADNYFSKNKEYQALFDKYDALENTEANPARNIKRLESGHTYYISKQNESDKDFLFISSVDVPSRVLYDPSEYSDGDYSIEYYAPSYDGKFVAIALGKQELFFNEIIIVDCITRTVIGNPISNAKPTKAGGISWTQDSKGIIYLTFPSIGDDDNDRNSYTTLTFIKDNKLISTPIFKSGLGDIKFSEEYYPVPMIRSEESNYLFVYIGNANDHWDSYYISKQDLLSQKFDNWKFLFSAEDKIFYDDGIEKDHYYYFKRINAGNTELCYTDLRNPDFKNPNVIVKGDSENQIGSFKVNNKGVYYTISTNGISEKLYLKENNKEIQKIELPRKAGNIILDTRSPYADELWVKIYGWTSNPREYHLNSDGKFELIKLEMWPLYPQFENLISEVIEVESYDGVKIPMSIIRMKNHKMDGSSIGVITAYGAYGIPESPWFHTPIADFVSQGNIYVSAHVRGGGEKGPAWHEAGKKSTKQNSWKDLIACSEYLINNKYIHPRKLGLNVNSAGAITGGMAVNERPDLFGVFTGFVPNLNVIRTEYLDDFDDSDTVFEFGTIKEKESYRDLLKMDPVVNLSTEKEYPSTLLIIGYKDYLISPSAPGKYIAFLQANSDKTKPYLLDVKFDAEHEIDWLGDYAKTLFFTMNELNQVVD